MKDISHRIVKSFLVFVMICTMFPYPRVQANTSSEQRLVNIAKECDTTVPENEGSIPNMFDGNINTIWSPSTKAGWPATVIFKLPAENMKPVEKIAIRFKVENDKQKKWAMDVKLGYYVNSVTDELVAKEVKGQLIKDEFVFEFSEPTNISHALVTMSNPTNGGKPASFWPQIAEMEIYVAEDAPQEDLINLAPNAMISCFDEGAGDKSNLIDEKYSSLYVIHNGGMSTIDEEAWVQLDLGADTDVNSLEIAFEKLATDKNKFEFTYSIYGMKNKDKDWTKIVANATANRTDKAVKEHLLGVDGASVKFRKFKIVLESIKSTGGDPWPAIAEFKIFGKEIAIEDNESVAWNKPTHTNTNGATASKVTDGDLASAWSGQYYPGYVDIDLEENYNISDIEVYLPSEGYSQYDIYTSMDGRDFKKLISKTNTESTPTSGDVYAVNVEARIVRVYVNYQSQGKNAVINEVRILGKKSGTPVQKTPEIKVENFEDSKYNVQITEAMTIEEVKGIVSRQLGEQYVDWFDFSLGKNPNGKDYDFFTIQDGKNGKIHITGNDGVSLATGLNHYLKYYLNVHISQVGNQVKMPAKAVSLNGKVITKETKLPIRYAYNYCTLSYSMAFWGEKEWRNELDWLALNGVNVVLDTTAQEEVWRRFLGEVGYTSQEAKDFISGPAYYAWSYMANMSGYGGPVHDSWFVERTELARKNQLAMRKLGMQPILQGYSGMVPVDIESKDPSTIGNVIGQGGWCGFTRPSMLNITSESFDRYADIFYKVQKEVYGDVTDFYAIDPYHEGGNPGGVAASLVGSNVLGEMMTADKDAIWIVQAWGGNPSHGLLQGVAPNKDHVLILDLFAEHSPRWEKSKEFQNTPWIYCMLSNFGGRLGLYGHIENFVNEIPRAISEAEHMKGIGITPEASMNNPVLYDLFFETIWVDDGDNVKAIDLDKWFKDYTTRRYGAESESAYQAMLILNETVYNPKLNMRGQGAPESIVNARPAMKINAASTWGNSIIGYDKTELEKAAKLLLEDFDKLKESEAYQYDLANVLEQILSNTAQEYHKAMVRAYNAKDLDRFTEISTKFLNLVDMVDKVTGTQEEFLVGTWIEQAKALATNADEFTKELYEFNARSLITTWGSLKHSGGLHDYSNRQWAGLTKDYYKPRWEFWIAERTKELKGEVGINYSGSDWFAMEWKWVNDNKTYATVSNGLDLKELGEDVLANYSVKDVPKDPALDDSKDLPVDSMTATVGSKQSEVEGPNSVLDGNKETIWHSEWRGTNRENLWINLHLSEPTTVDGLRYLPRQNGSNGIITGYVIEISKDNGNSYKQVASGKWENSVDWKLAKFTAEENVTDVRLKATASITDGSKRNYASAAEIRITSPKVEVPEVDKTELKKVITTAEEKVKDKELYVDFSNVESALNSAKDVLNKKEATEEEVKNATDVLQNAITALEYKDAGYSKVDEAIKKAESLNPDDYVDFSAVDKALKDVVRDLDITHQKEVDAMADVINDAIDALVKKVDKNELQNLVDDASKMNEKLYTEDTWKVFNEAFENAKKVLADEKATQEQVDKATQTLQNAIDGLKLKEQTPVNPETSNKPEGGNESDGPGTGDSTHLPLLIGLLGASGLGIAIEMKRRERKARKQR